ncbi:MAG TPA: PQQ-binding-like beta-propeller repeat protein [Stellaceae bacterium]|nr:PQQ-binding-like beta-propeller repeat protein [Stellaceae bacterium]
MLSHPLSLMRHLVLAVVVASLTLLTACEKDKAPLPGERVGVMDLEKQLAPDPSLVGSFVALPRPVVNANWPEPGGVPSHSMQHPALGPNLKIAWTADIGESGSRYGIVLASPVVVGDTVYVMDARHDVSAFRTSDGSRLWRTNVAPKEDGRGWGGGVAYDANHLYVTTGYGEVLSLNPRTGAIEWRVSLPTPTHTAPTVADGRIFVITIDDRLIVLSTDHGKELWRYEGIPEPARIAGGASPAVQGDIVVAPFSSGDVIALRVDNGRVLWTDNLAISGRLDALSTLADIRGRPIIDQDRVFAVSHSGLTVAIDLRTGERVWSQDVGGSSEPWVAGNFVYVMSSSAQIVCLTRDKGQIRWISQLDRYVDPTKPTDSAAINWTGPLLAGNRLVAVSDDQQAWSVSPYTGTPLGQIKLPAGSFVGPVVANQTLYLLTNDAKLIALR